MKQFSVLLWARTSHKNPRSSFSSSQSRLHITLGVSENNFRTILSLICCTRKSWSCQTNINFWKYRIWKIIKFHSKHQNVEIDAHPPTRKNKSHVEKYEKVRRLIQNFPSHEMSNVKFMSRKYCLIDFEWVKELENWGTESWEQSS